MISRDSAPFATELVEALATLDDALLEGSPTAELEGRVAAVSGTNAQSLLTLLRALHGLAHNGRADIAQTTKADARSWSVAAFASQQNGCPARLGRFDILGRIGAGGGGTVFLARDPQIGRQVALKVPRAESMFSPDARKRFFREAELVATIKHPSIVPVYEAGEADGIPYIVEEYSPGRNLADWLRLERDAGRRVSCTDAAKWMLQLADALARVHGCGIVHRDLKPANVLMEPVAAPPAAKPNGTISDQLIPRITDFGIAKLYSCEETVTASHAILGTAAYMSPEQARGETRDVGPSADVYSLGVILYEMLCGSRPITAESEVQLLRRIVEDEPTSVGRIRRDLPKDLVSICMKCLEKNPASRYADAAALRDDLSRYLDGKPVVARPLTAVKRSLRWCRRRPAHAALMIGAMMVVMGAAVGSWMHFLSLRQALEWTDASRKDALHHQRIADRQRQIAEERGRSLQRQIFCLDARSAQRLFMAGSQSRATEMLRSYENDPVVRSSFVWRYLWRLSHLEEWIWREPGSEVYWAEFSPDGGRVAAGLNTGSAPVWDVKTGKEVFRLRGHMSCVNSVRFTSDGTRMITGSCDGTIRVWDASTGQALFTFADEKAPVLNLAISPDGTLLAAGESKNERSVVALWDFGARTLLGSQEVGSGRVEGLAFSEDSKRLAAAAGRDSAIFDVTSGLKPLTIFHEADPVLSVAFVPGEPLIAWARSTYEQTGSVRLCHAAGAETISEIPCIGDVRSVVIDSTGKELVFGGTRGVVQFWNRPHGKLREAKYGHLGRITAVAMTRDGRRFASAGLDGTTRLWSMAGSRRSTDLLQPNGATLAAFSADGAMLVTCGGGKLRAFADDDWQEKYSIDVDVAGVSADPQSSTLATYHKDRDCVAIRDARTGDPLTEFAVAANDATVFHVTPSADGKNIVLCVGNQMQDWDAAIGRLKRVLLEDASTFMSVALQAQDAIVISSNAAQNSLIRADERASGMHLCDYRGQSSPVRHIALDADGRRLAGACEDNFVYIWDARTGRLDVMLSGHDDRVNCVAFTPDGRSLASGDDSGKVRIWDLDAQREALVLHAHSDAVRSLAFSPDGNCLVTASSRSDTNAGEVRIWFAEPLNNATAGN